MINKVINYNLINIKFISIATHHLGFNELRILEQSNTKCECKKCQARY